MKKIKPVKGEENSVSVRVDVDVAKIVATAAAAGVAIVGIVFGFKTYKKYLEWNRD
ncbi:MAG: hypothetical protein IKW01_01655 [Firmicutes bacterium]|nr:hypothetical protein [Bacillota bacterium]